MLAPRKRTVSLLCALALIKLTHASVARTSFYQASSNRHRAPAPPPLSDIWRTKDGLSWELVADNAPWAPRGMITGANGGVPVLHGRMWILGGGYVGTGGTTLSPLRYDLEQQPRLKTRLYHNDVWSSADGREWTCHLEDGKAPWPARSYHDTAAWDGKLWVLGGHRGIADHPSEVATEGNRNDVWYSEDSGHW